MYKIFRKFMRVTKMTDSVMGHMLRKRKVKKRGLEIRWISEGLHLRRCIGLGKSEVNLIKC